MPTRVRPVKDPHGQGGCRGSRRRRALNCFQEHPLVCSKWVSTTTRANPSPLMLGLDTSRGLPRKRDCSRSTGWEAEQGLGQVAVFGYLRVCEDHSVHGR
jgi:hypothetical protein